jgi:hypothetical protein
VICAKARDEAYHRRWRAARLAARPPLLCCKCGVGIERPPKGNRRYCADCLPVYGRPRRNIPRDQWKPNRLVRLWAEDNSLSGVYRRFYIEKFGKAAWCSEYRRVYAEAHPAIHLASVLVDAAILRGEIVPQPCIVCGKTPGERRIHAHHDDYSKPYDVTWLCGTHHKARHKKLRAIYGDGPLPGEDWRPPDMIETGGLMFGIPDAARQDTPLRDDVLQLGRLLDRLAPRQGQIIRERFLTERTLKEVGMEFHITRERVRQIEAKALARLRMFAGSTPPAPQEEART